MFGSYDLRIISETRLMKYVRCVSADKQFETVEFNEFLELMSKHYDDAISSDSLMAAFRWVNVNRMKKYELNRSQSVISSGYLIPQRQGLSIWSAST